MCVGSEVYSTGQLMYILAAIPPERYPAPLPLPPAAANSIFFFLNPPVLSGRISFIASGLSRVSLPVVHRFFFAVNAL